ncbi:MAG: tetratricopeptide repeat protein, partial [Thermodesulfobacteriota bacterium]
MKEHRWLLISSYIFLFCFVSVSSSWAQEGLTQIVKKIQPSTMVILTYNEKGDVIGQGSGFFISEKGDIITNHHLLQDASQARVKVGEKTYPITQILAEDMEGDLIRVSVDIPQGLAHPLTVSESIPEVGEKIMVIGNPLGLEQSVSDGIVSAIREIPGFGKIIQITAPISPGSSGSPVVNMKGEVIGVATFQLVEGQNLNFAIPGERILKLNPFKAKTFAEWEAGRIDEWLNTAEKLYVSGLILLWAEDYEKALSYFEKSIKKNPRYADVYVLIGYCKDNLGRYTEAVEAYKQAIRIKPDYAEAHYNLGVAYGNLGRYTEAVEAYKQAIRIKPDYAEAHYNLG